MAKIIVNGEYQEVELPLTVSDLIKSNNVFQPEMVSVQVNEEFVEREDFDTLQIKENDSVDFLYFMGGGQY
ncbi:MAG: sulfur carrier protein ThiS [Paludibacteraceae bacterium]|jgi:sulfur carrier protein|nr:sulfur carrier protein ThiS [Paludibacteraceae bacterium]MDD5997405.1 sulfur carrier protein ThiS [Bacteroidales bacterium]MBR6110433.1 sulfur carrier protein ThiS [Paludibacteraceae bacterium]MBS7364420.1 sulfur carrier protein ThiS [Paludibacteraceae bacterium]MCR5246179.1 sulfur carrier protein ThiS [Paludibacteraceae bacterium]